jgi:hypothetical protein
MKSRYTMSYNQFFGIGCSLLLRKISHVLDNCRASSCISHLPQPLYLLDGTLVQDMHERTRCLHSWRSTVGLKSKIFVVTHATCVLTLCSIHSDSCNVGGVGYTMADCIMCGRMCNLKIYTCMHSVCATERLPNLKVSAPSSFCIHMKINALNTLPPALQQAEHASP